MEAVLKLFVFKDIGCKLINNTNLIQILKMLLLMMVLGCIKSLHKTYYSLCSECQTPPWVSYWHHETGQFAVLLHIVCVWEQVARQVRGRDIGEGRFYILRE